MWHLRGGQFIFSESPVRRDPVENFKALWSGEASMVKTYTHCAETLGDPGLQQAVQMCLQLHSANEQALRAYINNLGDDVTHIDMWHTICSLKDAVAGVLGDDVTVSMLRKMEEDFLGEYLDKISAFENENLAFLQEHLIPNQERCYQAWTNADGQPQSEYPPQKMPVDFKGLSLR